MKRETNHPMKARLERMCTIIDTVLDRNGLSAKVAGGYVAGNGLLFSLSDCTFLNTSVRHELQEALQVKAVLATVGVVLVNEWLRESAAAEVNSSTIVEGEYEEIRPTSRSAVETVDILQLIIEHEQKGRSNGRALLAAAGVADVPTAHTSNASSTQP